MRLKGRFRDAGLFMRIIHSISRMSARCVLRFSPTEIQIVVPKGLDSVETWACLDDLPSFFSEYRVESNFNNQVNIEVSTESLVQALRSANEAGSETVIKLAKRDKDPVLSFEITSKSDAEPVTNVVHHVSIRVKRPADVAGLRTAEESVAGMQPNIVSRFPAIAEVRSVAERMKSLDPDQLTIAANRSGQFKLIMSNSTIKVDTTWSDLQKGDDAEMADAQSEVSKRFKSVEIDLKSFLKLVSCQLPEHETELWIFSRACATFVYHINSNADSKSFCAHIMIHLPGLGSGG